MTPDKSNLKNGNIALIQPVPKIDWIIEDWIEFGKLVMLTGDSGTGKSCFTISLGVCVSAGIEFLGHKTTQGDVLFLDEESGKRLLEKRLTNTLRGYKCDGLRAHYITNECFTFSQSAHIDVLGEIIQDKNIKLVIVDSLVDIMLGIDENDATEVQKVFQNMRVLTEKNGCSFLIIHHNAKKGGFRGSSAILAALDLMFDLSKNNGSTVINVKTIKVRDGEPFEFSANMHFEPNMFYLTEASKSIRSAAFSKSQLHVISYLFKFPNSSIENMKDAAPVNFGKSAVRQAVYSLNDTINGYIVRTNPGISGKGVQALYDLTQRGIDYAIATLAK